MTVAACLKWYVPPGTDARYGGLSPADAAALEWALRLGDATGEPVLACTLGPAGADAVLREALAAGATGAVRIDGPVHLDSSMVALALAQVLRPLAPSFVCCGDYSLDRGSGSVPAFLAAELGARQALGLVALELGGDGIAALRRLDGGRREELRVGAPAVLSVEGATAVLRRASLAAAMTTRRAAIEVVEGPFDDSDSRGGHLTAFTTRPYRPRARVLPGPTGTTALERVRDILTTGVGSVSHADPVTLDPPAAADRILAALTEWGYLP